MKINRICVDVKNYMTCQIRSRVTVAGKVLVQIGEEFKKYQVVSLVFIANFEVPTVRLLPLF
jgi:hypothetical protein